MADDDEDDLHNEISQEALDALKMERQVLEISHAEQVRNLLLEAAPSAALQIVALSQGAMNENIKFNAAKYLVDNVLDPNSETGKGLLEDIMGGLIKDAEALANGRNV